MADLRDIAEGLTGATMQVAFGDQDACRDAVTALMSDGHGHHFAVVGEGCTLRLSPMAVDCLQRLTSEEARR